MNRNTTVCLLAASFGVIGCAATGGNVADGEFDAEPNALGVARIIVDHTSEHGDSVLRVQGLDDAGNELGALRVRTGTVLYSADDGMPERPSFGTDLLVSVGDMEARSVTPDVLPHKLYTFGDRNTEAFLELSTVATSLDQEVGITTAFAYGREVAFTTSQAVASQHPNGVWSYQSCFDGNQTVATFDEEDTSVRTRAYNVAGGGAGCRASDGVTVCSLMAGNCTFGVLGFKASYTPPPVPGKFARIADVSGHCAYQWFTLPQKTQFTAVQGSGVGSCPP